MLAFTPTSDAQIKQAWQDNLNRLYAKFSDTGKGYRSLNKTLANFPNALHDELTRNLKYVHLRREIKDPLEFSVLLHAIKESQGKELNPLWQYATRDQIIKAMRITLREDYSVDDPSNVSSFVIRLIVYEPPNFKGGIVGLADRVNKEMQQATREKRERTAMRIGLETELMQPSSLPKAAGVTFIDTIARLLEEGNAMNNCVMDYAERAVKGEYYFFHVEKAGEMATTKLTSDGKYESKGKNNKSNAASYWQWWERKQP